MRRLLLPLSWLLCVPPCASMEQWMLVLLTLMLMLLMLTLLPCLLHYLR